MLDLKKTINIPKTSFPMKGDLINKEINIIKKWNKINIYKYVNKCIKKNNTFFLHDGPPYANGDLHVGHAVNKILKDIIIKSKKLSGFNSPFIPGWDCHGLPIELQIKNLIKNNNNLLENNNFFKICRNYVLKQINNQKKSFIRLGIFADWNNSYLTMNFKSQSKIIDILGKLLNLGFLNRYNRPVYWCIKCKSNISEFETKHYKFLCKSAYIKYKLINFKNLNNLLKLNKKNINLFFISWTTTIWTLLDTKTISIKKDIIYSLILFEKEYYILSKKSIEILFKKYNFKYILDISGEFLINIECIHPITKKIIYTINNDYIDENIGTSIVNIAPGHNLLDYEIGIKNNIDIVNSINEDGFYINYDIFNKKYFIFDLINIIKDILNKRNKLFKYKEFYYKYPFCIKHKYPIIFRLTYQWFINLEHNNLRKKAIDFAEKINWIPYWGKNKIKKMLISRSNWCISRQRKWGVPITFLINKKNNEIHKNSVNILNKSSKMIKKYGIEWWIKIKKSYFLKKDEYNKYYKSNDILDVWFDSGSSMFLINSSKYQISDLYLEGVDQYRGWFMSSLLISIALNNKSKFNSVLTHGFVLNKTNEKMSKSLKNDIKINDLLKIYGADIVRLWVANSNYTKNIKISLKSFNTTIDIYKKIRNILKYMISVIHDFNIKKEIINYTKMVEIDKWIINQSYNFQCEIINLYNKYNFKKIISKIVDFFNINLSSLYLEITKDRQYTLNKNSIYRKSFQSTIFHILEFIIRIISPILSFTSEEIWNYMPLRKKTSIFYEKWYNKLKNFNKNNKINEKNWNFLFNIKKIINNYSEIEIKNKKIKNSLELDVLIYIYDKNNFNILKKVKNELKYMFLVSYVKIIKSKNLNDFIVKINRSKYKIKCERCWNFYKKSYLYKNNICKRCINNVFKANEKRIYV